MSKKIYCAKCGTELEILHKALPKQHLTIMVVAPHTCPEESPEFPFHDINGELSIKPNPTPSVGKEARFAENDFVKKINDLNETLTDKRPKEDLHPSTKSGTPSGVLNQLDLLKKGS